MRRNKAKAVQPSVFNIRKHLDHALDYLVNTRGIDRGRLTAIDGGYREEPTIELWLVPPGATPPRPTPTLQSHHPVTDPWDRRSILLGLQLTNVSHAKSFREASLQCPAVKVSCPAAGLEGDPVTFTAEISDVRESLELTFNWTVSAGTITFGQGTSSITVDASAVGGQKVQATVAMGGFPSQCPATASCSSFINRETTPRKISAYTGYNISSLHEIEERLEAFAINLQSRPTFRGHIIAYGGRRERDRGRH